MTVCVPSLGPVHTDQFADTDVDQPYENKNVRMMPGSHTTNAQCKFISVFDQTSVCFAVVDYTEPCLEHGLFRRINYMQ